MTPPAARQIPHELTAHGDVRQDPYYWLRDREDPEVLKYLEAENAYTAEVMKPQAALVEEINTEILSRIQQTDETVPARRGEWLYYSRTEEGKQYGILCRRKPEGSEQIILDVNQLAEGKAYFALGGAALSEDGKLLAFLTDENGSEEYTLRVKELRTGEMLAEAIPDTAHGVAWANDNRTLFYVRFDETKRPDRVFRHVLGADTASDTLVFTEPDERFTFELGKTRSGQFLAVTSINASTTSEVFLLNADKPEETFTSFAARETGVEYYIDHQGDRFLIRTNAGGAARFQLSETPVHQTAREHWRTLRAEWPDATLEEVHAFETFFVLETREKGLPAIRIVSDGEEHPLEFPEPAYAVAVGDNFEYQTHTLRYVYTSLITPLSTLDYDLHTHLSTLLKQTNVPGGFDASRYRAERLEATAPDGTKVPMSLVSREGFERNGENPVLLYGYGSYGINTDAQFTVSYFSLIDRGFAVALAHVRGGAEAGREWFEAGRMLHKQNSFSDFIACAEHLVSNGYTSPNRLCAMGGSAGGLLMGAIVNQRPDLFQSVVAMVPFVDVVTTMSDPTIPLTTGEYDQWGNPEDEQYYRYMKTYSPYDNVKPQRYPNMLVTTGINDPRVAYWEPAKWVARLRAMKTDQNLLLLKTELGAGHGGPSGRYEKFRETAFNYAFLLKTKER